MTIRDRAPFSRRGLYAISNGPRPDLIAVAEAALRGGAVVLQYRDKTDAPQRRLDEALALAGLCRRHGAVLIVNDDVELAAAAGAGLHLGEHDATLEAARARLGRHAIIGVSCYDSLERARAAAAAGADYVAFGAFHASATKPNARQAPPGVLRAAAGLGLPRVAIGGITPENAPALIAAGADLVAVVSGVFDAADPAAAAARYAQLFPPLDHGLL